MIVVSEIIFHT